MFCARISCLALASTLIGCLASFSCSQSSRKGTSGIAQPRTETSMRIQRTYVRPAKPVSDITTFHFQSTMSWPFFRTLVERHTQLLPDRHRETGFSTKQQVLRLFVSDIARSCCGLLDRSGILHRRVRRVYLPLLASWLFRFDPMLVYLGLVLG